MSIYFPLFEHMQNEHGLTLTDSELREICRIAVMIPAESDTRTLVERIHDAQVDAGERAVMENLKRMGF
jgi:hypothetical protein